MKAAILTELNSPLVIDEVELTPLKVGQVLVKVLISGLCGAQLQEIAGLKGNGKFLPHLLGHEGCGIVEEIGVGVTNVKVGDKVIMHWRKGNGIEAPFPTYIYKGKEMSSGKVTTLSEYTIASENRLTPVPKGTPVELCALLGCGLSTALGTINNDAKIKFGETVLVVGCGGVGINLIQGARLAGAGDIYAVDITDSKKTIAESFGATYYNLSDTNNSFDALTKFDCIIDTTGVMETISKVIPKLAADGRIILISQPKQDSSITFKEPSKFFLGEGQTITSTQGGKTNPSVDFARYIKLWEKGMIHINTLITHTYSLDEINTAIDVLKSGNAGRILIRTQ